MSALRVITLEWSFRGSEYSCSGRKALLGEAGCSKGVEVGLFYRPFPCILLLSMVLLSVLYSTSRVSFALGALRLTGRMMARVCSTKVFDIELHRLFIV